MVAVKPIEAYYLGDVVVIARAPTGVSYTNQVNGVCCSHPVVEGFPVAAKTYNAFQGVVPDIFHPDPVDSSKPLPENYMTELQLAVAKHFPHLVDFEVIGHRAKFPEEDAANVEAWVNCKFRVADSWGKEPSKVFTGIITWPNSD